MHCKAMTKEGKQRKPSFAPINIGVYGPLLKLRTAQRTAPS